MAEYAVPLNKQFDRVLQSYEYDAAFSVWRSRSGTTPFTYSDGAAVEDYLLDAITRCKDVRSGSPDLLSFVYDWPTLYHLGPARANLLRPIENLLRGDTLEIGAGCGALTRYLGELGASVVAVEGSIRRAHIAAVRCRSLNNVAVVCDTLDSFDTETRFDTVLVVGVLEYCRRFGLINEAVEFLARCKRFLRPGGHLILAIENQLGLKYFCGAPEDHCGESYFGIENRYSNLTAVTWGRRELLSLLKSAGFEHLQEFYPFPDYKLPNLVLTEHPPGEEVTCDLLDKYGTATETGLRFDRAFSEALAWRPIVRNGLLGDFANSFLLLASDSPPVRYEGAYVYSTNRHPAFQKETYLRSSADGTIAERRALYSAPQPASAQFAWRPLQSSFKPGRVYSTLLNSLVVRSGWTLESISQWARPYYEFLVAHSIEPRDSKGEPLLPGSYIDCGPHNLAIDGVGQMEHFDVEWVALEPVPLGYVFFRTVLNCFTDLTATAPNSVGTNVLGLVRSLMQCFGLNTEDDRIVTYLKREQDLQSFVAGRTITGLVEDWQSVELKSRAITYRERLQLRSEIEALAGRVLAADAQNTTLSSKFEAQAAAFAAQAAALKERELAVRELSSLCAAAREEQVLFTRKRDSEIADLMNLYAAAREDNRKLQEVVLGQAETISHLLSSRSWRLTAPLRTIIGWASNLWGR